jgi:hypothetical protein
MDVHGFLILEGTSQESLLESLRSDWDTERGSRTEYCVGTNEYIDYEGFDDALRDYSIVELTPDEFDTLVKLFGSTWFGETGPIWI